MFHGSSSPLYTGQYAEDFYDDPIFADIARETIIGPTVTTSLAGERYEQYSELLLKYHLYSLRNH